MEVSLSREWICRLKMDSGFSALEMLLLILILVLFLAGTVLMLNSVIAGLPLRSRAGGLEEAAIDRVDALLQTARLFHPVVEQGLRSNESLSQDKLDFLADLDGNPSTGSFAVDDERGLERVVISRKGAFLMAYVYFSPNETPDAVTLYRKLSSGDPDAFSTEFQVKKGHTEAPATTRIVVASGALVTIAGGKGSERSVARRQVALPDVPFSDTVPR